MPCSPTRATSGVSSSGDASSETLSPSGALWLCRGLPGEVTPLRESLPKGTMLGSVRVPQPRGKAAALGVRSLPPRGEIFHPQPCSECGNRQESLSPAWGCAAGQQPSLWAVLRGACCRHGAGWEGNSHDPLVLQFLLLSSYTEKRFDWPHRSEQWFLQCVTWPGRQHG